MRLREVQIPILKGREDRARSQSVEGASTPWVPPSYPARPLTCFVLVQAWKQAMLIVPQPGPER